MLDNTAYDYALFEPKKERTVSPEVKALPQKKKQSAENNGKLTRKELIRYGIVFAALAILVGGFIATKAHYYELNNRYISRQEELKQLKSAHICLEVEYESNISVENIEDYAIDVLGMQVPQASQIKYITLTSEDCYALTSKKAHANILPAIIN